VEIKPAAGREAETGRVVARHAAAATGSVLLSSFSSLALLAAAGEAAHLPRALLVDAIPVDWRERMMEAGARSLHASARGLGMDALQAVRAAGTPLACYTLNRRDDAERFLAMGASAVFTDRPDLWAPAEM
jgi:glycerophosphoryl diester phosphodiesterase